MDLATYSNSIAADARTVKKVEGPGPSVAVKPIITKSPQIWGQRPAAGQLCNVPLGNPLSDALHN